MATLLLLTEVAAGQHYASDKPSTHGMMLMGHERVYASHLPMFHSPHHYQIILELTLTQSDLEAYRLDRAVHSAERVYTLEPETFVLPEMVNGTKKFTANIYRGHFERGGVAILKNVSVSIARVVYFKKFEPDEQKPKSLEYILFGHEGEQFLAHRICAAPDFDEILSVQVPGAIAKELDSNGYNLIRFEELDTRAPYSWGKAEGEDLNLRHNIYFKNIKQLYLEFGDLERP